MDVPMPVWWIIAFLFIALASLELWKARTDAVHKYQLRILDRILILDKFDIAEDRIEQIEARKRRYESATENHMMRQWWRSPDSFYKDCDFSDAVWNRLTAKPGSYTVKTTKVEEEPVYA